MQSSKAKDQKLKIKRMITTMGVHNSDVDCRGVFELVQCFHEQALKVYDMCPIAGKAEMCPCPPFAVFPPMLREFFVSIQLSSTLTVVQI